MIAVLPLVIAVFVGVLIGMGISYFAGYRPLKKTTEKSIESGKLANKLAEHVVTNCDKMVSELYQIKKEGLIDEDTRLRVVRHLTVFRQDHEWYW